MKKKETTQKPPDVNSPTSLPEPPQNEPILPPEQSRGLFGQWAGIFLLGIALYLFYKSHNSTAKVVLVAALLFQLFMTFRQRTVLWVQKFLVSPSPRKGSLLLFLALGGFSIGLLTFPNFEWLCPPVNAWFFQQSYWTLLVFWLLMVLGFWLFPKENFEGDFSAKTARFWLFVALGLAAFFRFYHLTSVQAAYWDDQAMEVMDVRYAKDMGDFRNFFIVPNGAREPFYGYFMYFLWMLLPKATSVVVQRLAGGIIDLAAIFVVYFAGKEAVNRRAGVLAAVLAAVSKPLIIKSLCGMRIFTMGLAMGLALLFFLRMVKKPTLSRFLQWGAAVAFGSYTYGTYHPVVMFFVFLAWTWVWLKQRKSNHADPNVHILVGATFAFLLFYFLYVNNVVPNGLWLVRVVNVSGPFLPCLLLGFFFIFAYKVLPKVAADDKNSLWLNWVAGSWLCAILSFPMMDSSAVLERMQGVELTEGGALATVEKLFHQLIVAFNLLFVGGYDRSDMMIPNDSLFGYSEIVLIALGLAWVVARPNWTKIILVLSAMIGFAPYVLSRGPHSGRAAACIVPFILLGAVGLDGFLAGFFHGFKSRFIRGLSYVLLLGLTIWTSWGVYTSVYDVWWVKFLSKHVLTEQLSLKDIAQGDRVYFAQSLTGRATATLCEGHPVYYLRPTNNVIYLAPDEKTPNLVVYLEPDALDIKNQLMANFPTAQWTDLHSPEDPGQVRAFRCFIPFADLVAGNPGLFEDSGASGTVPPGKFFMIHRLTGPYWERQYSLAGYGFTFGQLDWEDKVAAAKDHPDSLDLSQYAVKYAGVIHVNAGGKYTFALETPNRTIVRVDGKKILDLLYFQALNYIEAPKTTNRALYLEAGDHRVEVVTCFQRSQDLPDITLQRKGISGEGQSLWSSFNF